MKRSLYITGLLLSLALILPRFTHAQTADEAQVIEDIIKRGVPGVQAVITADKNKTSAFPLVPISAPALEAPQSGITIFGYNTGITWNDLAMTLAKQVVNNILNSTIKWMNSGFPNGGPAYVSDPEGYFRNLGNGILGDELNKLSKGVLCSPFQAKVTLALRQASLGSDYSPQCTLSGIAKNYDNFINNFQEGGWSAFFDITQNDGNNPYGAFANAQISINNKVQASAEASTKELSWGQGFLSQKTCKKYNISKEDALKWLNDHPDDPLGVPPGFVAGKDFGACIEYGPILTPGATIKTHLDVSLPANNFIRQLVDADTFDKLLNALINGSIQRFVFGPNGLLGKSSSSVNSDTRSTGSQPVSPVSCSASVERATANEDVVSWFVTTSLSNAKVDIVWKDDSGTLNGKTGLMATTTYKTGGQFGASVTATITKIDDYGQPVTDPAPTTRVYSCSNVVKVSQYHPLQVSCSANTPRIAMSSAKTVSDPVTWTAKISGGSGKYTVVTWDGDQQVPPSLSGLPSKIFPYELTPEQVNLPSINWCYRSGEAGSATVPHLGSSCDDFAKSGVHSGVTIQKLSKDPAGTATNPLYTSTLTRVYFRDPKSNLGSVKANITVWDADNLLEPVTNYQCPAVPVLDN